jgi:hypothetical protein
VLDHVERIVVRVAGDFDNGHAASTAPVEVEMRTPLNTGKDTAEDTGKHAPRAGCDLPQEQPAPAD